EAEWADLNALSAAWRMRFASLRQPKPQIELNLPDSWPIAEIKQVEPSPVRRPSPQMFEVLVYRPAAPAEDSIAVLPGGEQLQRRIDSQPGPEPPAPEPPHTPPDHVTA